MANIHTTTVLPTDKYPFLELVDLAAERVGGKTLFCSDEFFAPMENLLKPGRGEFIPGKYTDRGKWMDGWETRRHNRAGVDWCIIKLGLSGIIRGVDIDTNHFTGNYPPYASIEAVCLDDKVDDSSREVITGSSISWKEILPKSPLGPGSQHFFAISDNSRYTHIKLNIYPDGGVARLRVYGDVIPPWHAIPRDAVVDLAAVQYGGRVTHVSDHYFSSKDNLIMPGRSANMGDGWETKRSRVRPHCDWAIVKLGAAGFLKQLEIDTNWFKGNFPEEACVEAAAVPDGVSPTEASVQWALVLPRTRLEGHKQHVFHALLETQTPYTHVRLTIFPDGGVSRLRVFGVRAM